MQRNPTIQLIGTFALLLSIVTAQGCGDQENGASGSDAGQSPISGAPDANSWPDSGNFGGPSSWPATPPTGPNTEPELGRIGDRIIAVGEALVIVVEASDADGDVLSYSVKGRLPDGARFNKTERRFDWTPQNAGTTVFLTFVVDDGRKGRDRETVKIEVVAENAGHAPVMEVMGDQLLTTGTPREFQLVATDPDGDPLSFGHEAPLPKGAQLASDSGLFTWTPSAELAGQTLRITFTVTDGMFSDQLAVRFVISGGGSGGPAPPVWTTIPPQTIAPGQELTLNLMAEDPNGDPITYAIHDGAPKSATLNNNVFAYTPETSDNGMTWAITFAASDGSLTAYQSVDVSVRNENASCVDDAFEPNGTQDQATLLSFGTVQASLCDSSAIPTDTDFFAFPVEAQQQLELSIAFDAQAGDLDLFLGNPEGVVLTASESISSVEQVAWTVSEDTLLYAMVVGYGQDSFAVPYTLTAAISTPASCENDLSHEPNENISQARPLPGPNDILTICASDRDVWTIDSGCGQTLSVTMAVQGGADLDMALWPPGSLDSDAPIASAATTAATEILTLESTSQTGTYHLAVVGYPASTAEGNYTLNAQLSGGCAEDTLGMNHDPSQAHVISGDEGTRDGTICCSDDWFAIDLIAGEQLTVDLSPLNAADSAGLLLRGPDGITQLAAEAPKPGGSIVEITAESPGVHTLAVSAPNKTQYQLAWLVEAPQTTELCTDLSCALYDVCDPDTGQCVSDWCTMDSDCPSAHICRETYCVNACSDASDCRTGYGCKSFEDGRWCGPAGLTGAGQACEDFANCQGNSVCTFRDQGGYCAVLGCLDAPNSCPPETACVELFTGTSLCAVTCTTDADCRTDDGYTCAVEDNACLPIP